jgi:hypothetical protein
VSGLPGSPDRTGKKQRQDDTEFPWIIREQLSDSQLGKSLEKTLKLLKLFAGDLKFTKSSVINSLQAPPFPHSEWTNIIAGSMVDLDHVISGSFAVANDNREVERLGGMEVKFGITKPVKQVKTSGDWFIAWGNYSKAAVYVFPHRREEFDCYGTRILSLFSATSPSSHTSVINLDKGIRARAATFSSQIKQSSKNSNYTGLTQSEREGKRLEKHHANPERNRTIVTMNPVSNGMPVSAGINTSAPSAARTTGKAIVNRSREVLEPRAKRPAIPEDCYGMMRMTLSPTVQWSLTAEPLPSVPLKEYENKAAVSTINSNPQLFRITTPIKVNRFEELLSDTQTSLL